jgi:glutamate decarboxylase
MVLAQYYNFVRFGREGYTYIMEAMASNARALAEKLEQIGTFELIGADREQLPLVAFKLAGEREYDEFDVSWQLSAERGWMLPAYTMPPEAEDVKVMRALVKQTLSREQVDRLAGDIETACKMLEEKGGAHPAERKKMKQSPGY